MEERIADASGFDRAVEGLRTWAAHEGAGLRICPSEPVASRTAPLSRSPRWDRCGRGAVSNRGRLQRARSFGFAYGTLPGHPERGEESFVLERRDDRRIFTIRAFSRPVDPLARLSGPIGRAVQRSVTRRYVRAPADLRRIGATEGIVKRSIDRGLISGGASRVPLKVTIP